MHFSTKELSELSERAASLGERLTGGWIASEGHDPAALRRLERWRQVAGADQSRQLAAMLRLVGRESMTDAELLALLGPVKHETNGALPKWTHHLNGIVARVGQTFGDARPVFTRETGGIPYEHLYWPIAAFAWEEVVARHSPADSLLGEKVRHGLQRYLVQRIANIASAAIHPIFLAHKSFAASGMRQLLFGGGAPNGPTNGATRLYASFVSEQGQDGLRPVFTRFPVVARLTATVTRLWIDFVGEFLERLLADQGQLSSVFNDGTALGQACTVKVGVSDPHGGGRSVLILEFCGGPRLVYKPRPMGVDRAFYRLIGKLNEQHPKPSHRVLKILDRGEYGWSEFAAHTACFDRHAAKRYYRRAGSMACLVHWLQGIDFHRENVVAAGEYPVLVDLECLAHPLRPDEMVSAGNEPASALAHSVLRTGLLPMWQSRVAGGALYDNCGLNGPVSRQSFFPLLQWERINTDAMGWAYKTRWHRHESHRPVLNRRLLTISPFESDVLLGYREIAALLEGSGERRLSSLREEVFEAAARRIKRPTLIYGLLLRRSLEPAALSEGADRSIELMGLPCATGDSDWTEEISSLEKLDVPYFQFLAKAKIAQAPVRSVSAWPRLVHQEETVKSAVRRQVHLDEGKIVVRARHREFGARPRDRTITAVP